MRHLIYILFLFPGLILSCRTGHLSNPSQLSGAPGEVLVVMTNKDWNGIPGEACRNLFNNPYDMLPQYEPIFDVVHIPLEAYKEFFLLHRNILIADISQEVSGSEMKIQKDLLVPTQFVISLKANNDSAFNKLVKEKSSKIITLFDEIERQRIQLINQQNLNQNLAGHINTKHHVQLDLPLGYDMVLDTTHFTWFMKETGSILQNLIVYEYPDSQTMELSMQNLISARDEMLKKYLHGSVQGSFITTEKEFLPVSHAYSLHGKYPVTEIRGLWKMENGIAMGGPFLSVSATNDQNHSILTVEGFAYAAGFKKRNYVRELEAIVLSLKMN